MSTRLTWRRQLGNTCVLEARVAVGLVAGEVG